MINSASTGANNINICTFSPALQWLGSSPESCSRTTPCPSWQPSCWGFNMFPAPQSTWSEDHPSDLSKPLPLVGCWVGGTQPVGTSRSAHHGLGCWGGNFSCVQVWGTFWPGLRSCHIDHFDEARQGEPYCSLVYEILRSQPHSCHRDRKGLEVQFFIRVIRNTSTTGPRAPFHSPRKAWHIDMPPSSVCDEGDILPLVLSVTKATYFRWL